MEETKKRRTRKKRARDNGFDVIRQKLRGARFRIYCCTRCTRAWRFTEPVEVWRIQNLLKHQAGHTEGAYMNGLKTQAGMDAAGD